jgi:hypothetical protein
VGNLRSQGDIYLGMLIAIGLLSHACLSLAGVFPATPLFHTVATFLGLGLLLLPGYSVGVFVGLDRYGVAALASASVVLSLGVLALVGTAVWLFSRAFSAPLLEGLIGCIILTLNMAVLRRGSRGGAEREHRATRWAALGLIALPLSITVVVLGNFMPVSPVTRYTEFFVVTSDPTLTLAIVNAEGRTETYTIVVEAENGQQSHIGPIELGLGAQWEAPVTVPAGTVGRIQVQLYRLGDDMPYRTLWMQWPIR